MACSKDLLGKVSETEAKRVLTRKKVWREKGGRIWSGQMDGCMDGWEEVLELQAPAGSAAASVLGGKGIKALHINTIMKEKKKKVEQ